MRFWITHVFQRLVGGVVVMVGVTTLVFALVQLSGDPARILLPPEATPEQIAQFREAYGLDQPIPVQFVNYISRVASGDFGTSFRHQRPAMDMVLERLPATAALALTAMALALLISIPIGIVAAANRGSVLDSVVMGVALLGQATPVFLLGIILILVFSVMLGWLPVGGMSGPQSLILPGLTLGAYSAAVLARLLRSSLIQVLEQDYIRTARAKGNSRLRAVLRHAMKNAMIPVVTVMGLQVATLVGGAVITESVFSFPGMGRLALQSIGDRDFNVVSSFVIIISAIVVVTNLIVDSTYALLDPRVRATR